MIPVLLKYWKPLTLAAVIIAAIAIFNVWLSQAKSAAYTRGYDKAASECATAREAAQRARDAQLEAIRKEEARKREELQARLTAERERNAALDTEITEANRRAAIARRAAERKTNEALETDGLAGCVPTDGVRDNLADAMSAYRSRHGHGAGRSEAGAGEGSPATEADSP